MDIPETRYADSDGVKIAYQAFGGGHPAVVVPPLVSNVEVGWEHERYRRIFEYEAQHLRLVIFDKRGIGLSDRFEAYPTLEQRIDDIRAVMDAAGLERASLLGLSEGGLMAQLFANRHPERVDRMVLFNTYGTIDEATVAPYGTPWDFEPLLENFRRLVETWGTDPSFQTAWMMPSVLEDESFLRFVGRYQRLTASPAAIQRQIESVLPLGFQLPDPSTIEVPTMIVHATGDRVVPVACGRHLAATIPGATIVEFDHADHFLWVNDDWRAMCDSFLPFLHDEPTSYAVARRFGAVLFTDVVGSTASNAAVGDDRWRLAMAEHDRITATVIERRGGRLVKRLGDGLLAVFDTASAAIEAAVELRTAVRSAGVEVRAGVHAGELEVLADGDLRGVAVNLAARVQAVAAGGEVLVTSTVRELVLGGGPALVDRGRHPLKGFDADWQLFAVAAG